MQLNSNVGTFNSILKDFEKAGVLKDFILIGSWVLRVYKEHFGNPPLIPIVATQGREEDPNRII